MLRTETVTPQLLKVLHQLMKMNSLHDFCLVGGSALALQLGHRESEDIDLFSNKDFPTEKICEELEDVFRPEQGIKVAKDVMIVVSANGVKVDIVNDKSKFIRNIVLDGGIRMANVEEIAAMKIKIICDPFTGRKTKKDLADIATLLDNFTLQEMVSFFKEKYPTMAPYEEGVILRLNGFEEAEKTIMPKMFNELTWEKTKQKIENGLKIYFGNLLTERKKKLKSNLKKI